jgi:hypothetical protein
MRQIGWLLSCSKLLADAAVSEGCVRQKDYYLLVNDFFKDRTRGLAAYTTEVGRRAGMGCTLGYRLSRRGNTPEREVVTGAAADVGA